MTTGSYKIGYCNSCQRNVQHFRGQKTSWSKILDLCCLFILNFGPWYCSHCEIRTRCLPWIRRRKPTNRRIADRLDDSEKIGNFLRSDGSLVLRKKRAGRYSQKFREGVVQRLISGRTSVAQLCSELEVSESDLMSWVADLINARELRIDELTSLLRSYSKAATDLIGISDDSLHFEESENMIEGKFERRSTDKSGIVE